LRAAPRRSARTTTLLGGRARPASAARAAAGAFSVRNKKLSSAALCHAGINASYRASGRCSISGSTVLDRGDRAMAGERASMSAGSSAVSSDGEHLPLRDPELDAVADQARVERVVAAVDAHVGVGRDPGDEPCGRRRAAAASQSAPRSADRAAGSATYGGSGRWRADQNSGRAAPGSRTRSRTSGRTRKLVSR